jgi:hypothetical protein
VRFEGNWQVLNLIKTLESSFSMKKVSMLTQGQVNQMLVAIQPAQLQATKQKAMTFL